MLYKRIEEIYCCLTKGLSVGMGEGHFGSSESLYFIGNMKLAYGEILFSSISEILKRVQMERQGMKVFYDLGSGTGKVVLAAALLQRFNKCVGIEILDDRYSLSVELKNKYDLSKAEIVSENRDLYVELPDLVYLNVDLCYMDYSDADCIFCNSTYFSSKMIEAILSCPVLSRTIAITTTRYVQHRD